MTTLAQRIPPERRAEVRAIVTRRTYRTRNSRGEALCLHDYGEMNCQGVAVKPLGSLCAVHGWQPGDPE